MSAAQAGEPRKPILRMRGIEKSFGGVQALREGSLEILPGEVHALLGENGAGKSTLVKIIAGVYQRDGGIIEWMGVSLERHDLAASRRLGIRIIHQQLNAIDYLSVAENLALGQERHRLGFFSARSERAEARAALGRIGVSLDPDRQARTLRVAEKQLIEIARALRGGGARLLVMDEPTASLGNHEVERLFEVVRTLRSEGLGIIYISHKLDEVFAISDRITVLRDGRTVTTVPAAGTSSADLIAMMVGNVPSTTTERSSNARPEVRLSVRDLSTDTGLHRVGFDLRAGEILGVYGLLGSGRTELARALFGADPVAAGRIEIDAREVRFRSPAEARAGGVGFVPEERAQASYPFLTVRENATTAALDLLARAGIVLRLSDELRVTRRIIRDLKVRTPGTEEMMLRLSGGNQQKVIVGRWLLRGVPILILDDPTSGVDVGAKEEFYGLIGELTAVGASVLIISSELPELLAISDRMMVLHAGKVAGTLSREAFDQRAIIALAVSGTSAAGAR